jgi:hypothetical protein
MNMLPEKAGTDHNGSEKKDYLEYPVLGRKEEKEERRDMAGEKEIVGEDDTTIKQLDERVLQANQLLRRGKRHKIHGSHPGGDHERIRLERNQKLPRASAESSKTQH